MYRIKDWALHFENNRTADMVDMKWVPFPNKHDGDGFTELLDHQNGMAHLGAWALLVQVASKCGKPAGRCGQGDTPRGTLRRENGKPHDLRSIARVSKGNLTVIEEAVPRLIDIGWLEIIPDEITTSIIPQEGAATAREDAPIPQEGDDGKEGKGRERKYRDASPSAPALPIPRIEGEPGEGIGEAIQEIFGWKPATRSERTHMLALRRDFLLKGALPDELWTRVRRYRREWPKVECTPDALLKHWDRFAPPRKPTKVETDKDRAIREQRERDDAEWAALPIEERVRQMDIIREELRLAWTRCA